MLKYALRRKKGSQKYAVIIAASMTTMANLTKHCDTLAVC